MRRVSDESHERYLSADARLEKARKRNDLKSRGEKRTLNLINALKSLSIGLLSNTLVSRHDVTLFMV